LYFDALERRPVDEFAKGKKMLAAVTDEIGCRHPATAGT